MGGKGENQAMGSANVLIVDDDPDLCQMLTTMLQTRGYRSTVAYNGPDGLKQVETEDPDIVILDVMMPGVDGWETFRHIRRVTDAPVLVLTALNQQEYGGRARELGVDGYVQKPFYPSELFTYIEELLGKDGRQKPAPKSEVPTKPVRQKVTVSVVLPTLNEARNLPFILPYLSGPAVDEVVLVDGDSTDETVEIARRLLPSIKIVREHSHGKGAALRAGYRASSGDIIVAMDADGSHDPREIPRFIRALLEGADFARGTRFAPHGGTTDMPRYRKFGNSLFVRLVNLLFNCNFTDFTYGYHAFWRTCLDQIDYSDRDGFEFEPAIYLRALVKRLRIVEVPSFEGYRFTGIGKLKTIPDGWRILKTIFGIWLDGKRSPWRLRIGFHGAKPGRAWALEPGRSGAAPVQTMPLTVPEGENAPGSPAAVRLNHERVEQAKAILHLVYTSDRSAEGEIQDELLRHVLELALDSVGATSGTILALDDDARVTHAWWINTGHVRSLSPEQLTDTVQRGLAGWVFRNRQAALVPSTLEDPRWLRRSWEVQQGMARSALGIPLVNSNQVMGVLVLARPETERFTQKELELVAGIAA